MLEKADLDRLQKRFEMWDSGSNPTISVNRGLELVALASKGLETERLEKETNWLADLLVDLKICPTVKIYKCRYQEDKDYPRSECAKCWRKAVEEQCQK